MTEIAAKRRFNYVAAIVVAALCTGFGLLADEVLEGETLTFDNAVLLMFRTPGDPGDPIGPPWLEEAARDLTSLGSFTVLGILVFAVTGYFLLRRKARYAWFVLGSVIGGTILSNTLKALFSRDRPDLVDTTRVFTASFPSGHATLSAVVYLTLGVLLAEAAGERPIRIFYMGLAIFLTLTIGVTRLYLGVHYPTDVIAGWSLGTAWALLCWTVADYLRAQNRGNLPA